MPVEAALNDGGSRGGESGYLRVLEIDRVENVVGLELRDVDGALNVDVTAATSFKYLVLLRQRIVQCSPRLACCSLPPSSHSLLLKNRQLFVSINFFRLDSHHSCSSIATTVVTSLLNFPAFRSPRTLLKTSRSLLGYIIPHRISLASANRLI